MQERMAAAKKANASKGNGNDRKGSGSKSGKGNASAGKGGSSPAGYGNGIGNGINGGGNGSGAPFRSVKVLDPVLRKGSAYFGTSSHWMYKVVADDGPSVTRRFRDVVALEARLRKACEGCILPPLPDKHKLRAVEEGSSVQTYEFAVARCGDLASYLNGLVKHPALCSSAPLATFLTLTDDIGTSWPEVSSSMMTRLKESVATVDIKQKIKAANVGDVTEDDPSMGDLINTEKGKLSVILQAVPKLENATILMKEQSEVGSARVMPPFVCRVAACLHV